MKNLLHLLVATASVLLSVDLATDLAKKYRERKAKKNSIKVSTCVPAAETKPFTAD
jgi:hypothetical protein